MGCVERLVVKIHRFQGSKKNDFSRFRNGKVNGMIDRSAYLTPLRIDSFCLLWETIKRN